MVQAGGRPVVDAPRKKSKKKRGSKRAAAAASTTAQVPLDAPVVAAVATRSVAALIAVADALRVYVVNDDVAPNPQFRCLSTLVSSVIALLESGTTRYVAEYRTGYTVPCASPWVWLCSSAPTSSATRLRVLDGAVGALRRLLQLNHALIETRLGGALVAVAAATTAVDPATTDVAAATIKPAVALCTSLVGVYSQLRQMDTLLNAWFHVMPCPARSGPLGAGAGAGVGAGAGSAALLPPAVVHVLSQILVQPRHLRTWARAFAQLLPGQVLAVWEVFASELALWLPEGIANAQGASGGGTSTLATAAALLGAGKRASKAIADNASAAQNAGWLAAALRSQTSGGEPSVSGTRLQCLSLVMALARTFCDALCVTEHNRDSLESAAEFLWAKVVAPVASCLSAARGSTGVLADRTVQLASTAVGLRVDCLVLDGGSDDRGATGVADRALDFATTSVDALELLDGLKGTWSLACPEPRDA